MNGIFIQSVWMFLPLRNNLHRFRAKFDRLRIIKEHEKVANDNPTFRI